MYLFHINLNGISLLNLMVTAGIGVEFCQHLMQVYAIAAVRKPHSKLDTV